MTHTVDTKQKILEKYDEFIKDKAHYLVSDPNDPRVAEYSREIIKMFLSSSLTQLEQEMKEKIEEGFYNEEGKEICMFLKDFKKIIKT